MTVKEAARRLREFQSRVAAPHDFYAACRDKWQKSAAKLVVATVRNARPIDADVAAWNARAETLGSRVSATLLPAGEGSAGVSINLSERPADATPNDPRFFTSADVGIQDLVRFVQAGRQGDPNGKRL